jgi:hypothetical protein
MRPESNHAIVAPRAAEDGLPRIRPSHMSRSIEEEDREHDDVDR